MKRELARYFTVTTTLAIAKCGKTVATYSYWVYLTHMLALWIAFSGPPRPWFVQRAIFLVMFPGLAFTGYRVIEAPGIALGMQLSRRRSLALSAT
jgi:peptidoglycan/LPS O-acetylase OafA/YrhL